MAYPAFAPQRVATSFDQAQMRTQFGSLPIGTVGVWDNYRSQQWFGVSIEELGDLAFEVCFDARQTVAPFTMAAGRTGLGGKPQRCVVVRKTSAPRSECPDAER